MFAQNKLLKSHFHLQIAAKYKMIPQLSFKLKYLTARYPQENFVKFLIIKLQKFNIYYFKNLQKTTINILKFVKIQSKNSVLVNYVKYIYSCFLIF